MAENDEISQHDPKMLVREHAMRAHDRNDILWTESQKNAIDSANIAVRAILLVNGGAVVALLAFLGTLESANGDAISLSQFVSALRSFASGVGLAAVTAALAYLVNLMDADFFSRKTYHWEHPFVRENTKKKWVNWLRNAIHLLALGLGVFSLAAFFSGISSISEAVMALEL